MYNISISTSFDYDISIGDQIKLVKKYGYKCISLGTNYEHSGILKEDEVKKLKNIINSNNLKIDTIHGYNLDKIDTIEINEKILKSSIILECPLIVLHCSSFMIKENSFNERKKNINLILNKMKTLYEKYGIKYALENLMPGITTDIMEYALENSDKNIFGFCYDSSHDQIDGPNPLSVLNKYKNRLFTVHLSDRIKEFVDHVTIGEGFIDINNICKMISETSYTNPILMEVMKINSKYKDTDKFLEKVYKDALNISNKIEEYRNKNGQNCA